MTSLSHPDAGRVAAPAAGHGAAAGSEAFDPMRAYQYALQSSDAAWAIAAFSANQALVGQISLVHFLGRLAHEQSRTIEQAGEQVLPQGVARRAVVAVARLEDRWADTAVELANLFGRTFGRLAFAFPVAMRRS